MKRAVLFSLTDDEIISQKRVKNSKDNKTKPEILYSPDWYGYQDDTRIVWVLERDTLQVYSVWENGQPVNYESFTSTLYEKDSENVAMFLRNPPWRQEQKANCFGVNKQSSYISQKSPGICKIPVYRRIIPNSDKNITSTMNFQQRFSFQKQFEQDDQKDLKSNVTFNNGTGGGTCVKESPRIYECVGWMDLGNFIVVVERPQKKLLNHSKHIPFSSIIPIKAYLIEHSNNELRVPGLFESDDPINMSEHISTFLSNKNKGTKLIFHSGTMMTPLLTEMIQCLFSSSSPVSSFDSNEGMSLGEGRYGVEMSDELRALEILKNLNGLVLSSCQGVSPKILRMLLRDGNAPNGTTMGPTDVYKFLDDTTSLNQWTFNKPTFELNSSQPPSRFRSRPSSFNQMNISEVPLLSVITSLDLSFSQLNNDCCRPLAAALLSSGSLHTLNLSGNIFTLEGAKFLALGFEGNSSLYYLNLCGNHFNEGIDEISKSLARHPHLEVLMLDGCRLGVRGALALATYLILPGICPLRCLSLTNNDIGSDGYVALQAAISSVTNKIERDEEEGFKLQREEMMQDEENKINFLASQMTIGEDFKNKKKADAYRGITKLNVAFNGISKLTIPRSIINGLQMSAAHCIKYLDLSNNALNDEGCLSLSRSLPSLPGLSSLNLSYNLLGIKGLYPLLTSLPFMKIEALNLSGNPLDTPSMWALAFSLSNDHHLAHLDISDSGLSTRDAVAAHFAVALLSNPKTKLESLDGIDLSVALRSFGIDQDMVLANYGGTVHPKSGHVRNCDVIRWIKEFKSASEEHAEVIKKQETQREKLHYKENFYKELYKDRKSPTREDGSRRAFTAKDFKHNVPRQESQVVFTSSSPRSPYGGDSKLSEGSDGTYRTRVEISLTSSTSDESLQGDDMESLNALMGGAGGPGQPQFQQQFLQQMQQQHLHSERQVTPVIQLIEPTQQKQYDSYMAFNQLGSKRAHSRTSTYDDGYEEENAIQKMKNEENTLNNSMVSLFIGNDDEEDAIQDNEEDMEHVYDENNFDQKSIPIQTIRKNGINGKYPSSLENVAACGSLPLSEYGGSLRSFAACNSLPLSEDNFFDDYPRSPTNKEPEGPPPPEYDSMEPEEPPPQKDIMEPEGPPPLEYGIMEPEGPPPQEDMREAVEPSPQEDMREREDVHPSEGSREEELNSNNLEDLQKLIQLRNEQNNIHINAKPLNAIKSFSQFRNQNTSSGTLPTDATETSFVSGNDGSCAGSVHDTMSHDSQSSISLIRAPFAMMQTQSESEREREMQVETEASISSTPLSSHTSSTSSTTMSSSFSSSTTSTRSAKPPILKSSIPLIPTDITPPSSLRVAPPPTGFVSSDEAQQSTQEETSRRPRKMRSIHHNPYQGSEMDVNSGEGGGGGVNGVGGRRVFDAPPPFRRCIFNGIPDRFYNMVSGVNSPSQNKSNQDPAQMISLMQYVPFDEAEIDTLVELFQFRNPGGPLLPHASMRRGGIDALPNQQLSRSLIQQGETKQIAAKMKLKERDLNDRVVTSTRDKELSELRSRQAESVPGSEEVVMASDFITKTKNEEVKLFEQNWSNQLFDKGAFPDLREHVEVCLHQRMYMDALVGMREMFYGSLYRGAGGWCTRRVLIVDDSKVIRNFLRRLMERGGYTTDVANNGGEALVMMRDRFYDMVFLDLEMPVMNGLDCATSMREWEEGVNRTYRQPMCAVSSPSVSKKLQALGAGFNHYQHKPVQKKLLLDIASSRC